MGGDKSRGHVQNSISVPETEFGAASLDIWLMSIFETVGRMIYIGSGKPGALLKFVDEYQSKSSNTS